MLSYVRAGTPGDPVFYQAEGKSRTGCLVRSDLDARCFCSGHSLSHRKRPYPSRRDLRRAEDDQGKLLIFPLAFSPPYPIAISTSLNRCLLGLRARKIILCKSVSSRIGLSALNS